MRVLYLDCFSGIAGDMTLAALLDLGAPLEAVRMQVAMVAPPGLQILADRTSSGGISATKVKVAVPDAGAFEEREHAEIAGAIRESRLEAPVKAKALAIFAVLAEAESKAHGVPVERVHFHEIGAWDSIADIVGVAAALHELGIEEILASSPIPLGSGRVQTRHGVLPIPAPATIELLAGIPVLGTDLPFELTTPTGAAILRALAASFGPIPHLTVERIGYGAGTHRLPDRPNVLRALLGQRPSASASPPEWLLQTALDDASPQLLGHVQTLLFENGALDVWMAPIYMKKNRPGIELSVLCTAQERPRLSALLLTETTSIGLREMPVSRIRLERRTFPVQTRLGPASAKIAFLDGKPVNVSAEFEEARELARRSGCPLKDVLALIVEAAKGQVANG
jgi:uncharacterized protein (TIGR00299 family) protein